VQDYRLYFLPIVLICIGAELVWSRRNSRDVYSFKETASNVGMMVGNRLLRPVATAWALLILALCEPLQIVQLPKTAWSFALTFVAADFAYYWYHRLSHEVPLLWAMHHTHHSSPWMNFTTALRLNWVAKFVAPIFFIPFIIIGFPPLFFGASLTLVLLCQFFLHTQAIGRLGAFEGKLLNTPSAHRVHHGTNAQYLNKNYGGVLIVWDRLFGTYAAEQEPVTYGVTTGFAGHNILTAQFAPLLRYFRARRLPDVN